MDTNTEEKSIESPPVKEKGVPGAVDSSSSDSDHMGPTSTLDELRLVNQKDPDHPIHWNVWKKWLITSAYCLLQVFITISTTSYVSAEFLIKEKFGSTTQVITLGQSLFIVGTAIGPAFLGPLSDIGGRKWVYAASILAYAILNIGSALAQSLPMLIIFQFLCGTAGSTAVSNVAGTVSDLFGDRDDAGQAMALFVWSANAGASLGSPIGEWIADNASMGLPWIFWINVIIGGAFAVFLCFIPETLPRVVIARAVEARGTSDANEMMVAKGNLDVLKEMRFVTTMAFRIMVTEPIVTFLAIYNGFAYGLLFLYLDGVFDIFAYNNHLSYIDADLTFLNFIVGVTVMFAFMPVQTYLFKRDRIKHGQIRPEARFLTSLVTIWLFPISLLWCGFTSDGSVTFWSPMIAGAVLGFADPLLYLSMLNYITDAYPHVAASAIAAFVIPSFGIAAAFAHIGLIMFDKMSTTWAMATLGFVSFSIVGLVYVLYFFGLPLRRMSKLARSF